MLLVLTLILIDDYFIHTVIVFLLSCLVGSLVFMVTKIAIDSFYNREFKNPFRYVVYTSVFVVKLIKLSHNVAYLHHETFSFMMSLPTMYFGGKFYVSRKVGQGEVDGFTHRVKKPRPYLGSAVERPWSALFE